MAKRLLPPDWHVTKDNGDPATDATLAFRLAGTSTATPIWYDKDLTLPTTAGTSSVSCDATGYPAASGNDVAIWGADDVTYDVIVTATGYNGGAAKTLEDIAVADSDVVAEGSSNLVFGNAFSNGGFDVWTGGSSFSDLSGDGDGDEFADGWFLSQSTAAGNAASRQDGFAVGAGAAEARYCARVGRANLSAITNQIRIWKTIAPEQAFRLRGKTCKLRYTVRKGATFSSSGDALSVILATGTTESEDGDLIASSGFAGHQSELSTTKTLTTSAQRFEDEVTFDTNIKEIGVQFAYTPSGTAGATDYFEIEDVELKEDDADEEFSATPEPLEYVRGKLGTMGRELVRFAASAPGANRGLFWDHSALAFAFFSVGTGLAFTATTLGLETGLADISALAKTDSNFIVGNGTTWVAESGATARTSLGLGTTDAVSFASVTASQGAANTTPSLTVVNTTDNAAVRVARLEGDRATPTLNDTIYKSWFMSNGSGTQVEFARETILAAGITAGSETGQYRFGVQGGAGSLVTPIVIQGGLILPGANDGTSIGVGTLAFSDVFIASGGVINANNGDATITHVSGGFEVGGTWRGRTPLSSETSGTLTAASANKRVKATAGVTINDGVFTAEDAIEIYNDSDSSITITQDTGMTLRLAGVASTTGNRTLAARGIAYVYFDTNADAAVGGTGVT